LLPHLPSACPAFVVSLFNSLLSIYSCSVIHHLPAIDFELCLFMLLHSRMEIYLDLFILPKCLSFLLLFPFMMIEGFVAVILLRSGLLLIAVSPPGIDVLPSTVLSASNCWVGLLKVKR
jgi:hypothetical protein